MERYKQHVVDQALTLLKAHDSIRCLFTTPKLLEALCEKVSLAEARDHRRLLRRHRDDAAVPPLRGARSCSEGVYFAPTYGNTLMGLAVHRPRKPGRQLGHHLLPAGAARHDRGGRPERARRASWATARRAACASPRSPRSSSCRASSSATRPSASRRASRIPWDGVRNVRPFSRLRSRPSSRASTDAAPARSCASGAPVPQRGRRARRRTSATREPLVEVSQANPGLVRRDLREEAQQAMRASLAALLACASWWRSAARAAELFANGHAAARATSRRRPTTTCASSSATTGLPHVMVRRNMEKIRAACWRRGERVLAGLTRGLDLDVLDRGIGEVAGARRQLRPARAHARRRAAEQLARRPRALGAGDRAARRRSC